MMRIGAVFIWVIMVLGAADAAAKKPSMAINLLAQEFYKVCIETDADTAAVEAAAGRRNWRRRPEELSVFDNDRADAAWDGDLSSISVLGEASSPSMKFTVTQRTRAGGQECAFLFDDAPMSVLKAAMTSIGLNLAGESSFDYLGAESQAAAFCVADESDAARIHEIVVYRRKIIGWPSDTAVRLIFRRLLEVPSIGAGAAIGVEDRCPIVFTFYDFWMYPPEQPRIEPWLGQKPIEPPTLDGKSQ